jgi:hypothetical protein
MLKTHLDHAESVNTQPNISVKQCISKVKTETSKKSIPLDDVLIEKLLTWRRETLCAQDGDCRNDSTDWQIMVG